MDKGIEDLVVGYSLQIRQFNHLFNLYSFVQVVFCFEMPLINYLSLDMIPYRYLT